MMFKLAVVHTLPSAMRLDGVVLPARDAFWPCASMMANTRHALFSNPVITYARNRLRTNGAVPAATSNNVVGSGIAVGGGISTNDVTVPEMMSCSVSGSQGHSMTRSSHVAELNFGKSGTCNAADDNAVAVGSSSTAKNPKSDVNDPPKLPDWTIPNPVWAE